MKTREEYERNRKDIDKIQADAKFPILTETLYYLVEEMKEIKKILRDALLFDNGFGLGSRIDGKRT